jgi:hypothetical protein
MVVPVPVGLLLCCFASGRTSNPEVGSVPCSGSVPVRRGGFGKAPQNWSGAGVFVGIRRVSSLPEPKPLHSGCRTVRTGPLPSPTVCRFRETHGTHPHTRNSPPTPPAAGRCPPAGCRRPPPAGRPPFHSKKHVTSAEVGSYVVLTDRLQSSTVVPTPGTVHVRRYGTGTRPSPSPRLRTNEYRTGPTPAFPRSSLPCCCCFLGQKKKACWAPVEAI